jgi:hypothetical protein
MNVADESGKLCHRNGIVRDVSRDDLGGEFNEFGLSALS